MRQAGVLAAAAHHALQHNVGRLAEDHENAALLAQGLAGIAQLNVGTPQTNIFWMDIPAAACAPLSKALAEQGIRASIGPRTRLVTHLDISRADVDKVVGAFNTFFQNWRG
jgi:threonine aldolase